MPEPGLDGVGQIAGLGLELFEFLDVFVVFGPAGEEQELVGLVPPSLEPVGAGGHRPVDQPLEPVELIA